MKNQIIILAFTFIVSSLIAQQKGINQLPTANRQLPTSTYAVVVGISDYQDPGIPDLRFADKDAEAFASYLRSNPGGKLDNDHLKVLINHQATMAQFGNALDWLIENAKEGDRVIIYFSGHGDVEKKTITQPGFLLCWDAPAKVYIAGGTMALPILQEVISTLSVQNKSKVLVITDACRSGKLAGQSVNGSQATAANLSRQFANEIKIMSCQPNEYSIEGEQWGGGRGAFSFHLINALNGLADKDDDKIVTLQEVGRFLEDHVSEEVAPVKQVPMVVGDRYEHLSTVDEIIISNLRNGKNNPTLLTSIESRGIEDEVLSLADTTIKMLYQQFKQALSDKKFLEPENACADNYYEKLIKEPSLLKLHSTIKRNYAAALQDDAQQIINKFLNSDPKVSMNTYTHWANESKLNAKYLERAAELLGQKHYMFSIIKARKHYFMGIYELSSSPNPTKPDSLHSAQAIFQFRKALEWYPNMPNVFCWLIFTNKDSAEFYASKATSFSPNWIVPYVYLADVFIKQNRDSIQAKKFLQMSSNIDSNSQLVNYEWGYYYFEFLQNDQAIKYLRKAIASNQSSICFPCANQLLAISYANSNQFQKAEDEFKNLLKMDSTEGSFHYNYCIFLTLIKKYQEAEMELFKSIQYNYHDMSGAYYQLACIYSQQGMTDKSMNAYETALQKGFQDLELIQNDSDMDLLKKQGKWNELMKKYFPERIKN
jgi:tetratricopeptide (TPR) repeat protein